MYRWQALTGALICGCGWPLTSCAPEPRRVDAPAPIALASDPPPSPSSAPAADPLVELRPGYKQRLRRRAALAVAGRLYFEHPGEVVAEAERPIDVAFELVVVEETPRFLRVVLEDSGAAVLAYVPRTDIAVRVTAEVRLLADPLPKPDRRPGIFLRPGAQVEVAARTQQHFRVQFRDADLECEGYVPKSVLGRVYEPQSAVIAASELTTDSELLTAPGGQPLPCALSSGVHLVSEIERSGDYTLVEYTSSHLRLVGWVRSARVHNASTAGFVRLADLGGFGRAASSETYVTLRGGAKLFSAQGGPIGRTLAATQLPLVSRAGERSELRLNLLPWGPARVWVANSDVAAVQHPRAEEQPHAP
ncbi:MAG: hypothetical protein R3B07_01495 [Polyangiaceae bacterium]